MPCPFRKFLAKHYGQSDRTVRRWMAAGVVVGAYRKGTHWRIRKPAGATEADIDRALRPGNLDGWNLPEALVRWVHQTDYNIMHYWIDNPPGRKESVRKKSAL
jgi:hypothetical protein